MAHIHKKIRHHMTKNRAPIITFISLLSAVVFLSGAFLLTRGSNPATSELTFTERSSVSVGSVIPASCESAPWLTANGDGNYSYCATVTCWDSSVITPAMGQSCPTPPANTTCTDPAASNYNQPLPCTYPAPIDGTCGGSVYTCNSGRGVVAPTEDATSWSWWCGGTNVGSAWGADAWCYIAKPAGPAIVIGECAASHYSCIAGTSVSSSFDGTTYLWNCEGANTGTTAFCSENAAAPAPAACSANGPLSWAPGCSGYFSGTVSSGSSATVDNTAAGYTGSQNYSCNNGSWSFVSETCNANASTCADPAANNYGASGACTYSTPSPTATISANPTTVTPGNGTTLTWSSTDTQYCERSTVTAATLGQYVSGQIPTSGTVTTSPLQVSPTPFNLRCLGTDGTYAYASVSVNITGPDLTAGAISPTTATAGIVTTLSATISNIGDLSTGASFNNFIQVANAANGGGTITDLPSASMTTLASGASDTISAPHTFALGGTYSARACADKSSRVDAGTITESNENNNCGPWTNIAVTANPSITNQVMNFPNVSFVCHDSTTYSVTHNESGTLIASGATTDGATVTVPVSAEGNYTLKCINGAVFASAVVNYTIPPMTPGGVTITSSPRTVSSNKNTTLFWSILNPGPLNTCSLKAEAVCSGGRASCSQAQLSQETSINSTLTSGTTDANDPYGPSRNIQTAVSTPAPLNDPARNKALGKATVLMNYSTDFILDCGKSTIDNTPIIKKIRIVVTDETEG